MKRYEQCYRDTVESLAPEIEELTLFWQRCPAPKKMPSKE